jgi:hypothetical protein
MRVRLALLVERRRGSVLFLGPKGLVVSKVLAAFPLNLNSGEV